MKKWQWQIKHLNTVFVCVYALTKCVAAYIVYWINFKNISWICLISILPPLIKVSVLILPSNYAIFYLFSWVNYIYVAVKNINKLNLFWSNKGIELLFMLKHTLPQVAQLTPEGGSTYPRGGVSWAIRMTNFNHILWP